jgi:hypothetical protein
MCLLLAGCSPPSGRSGQQRPGSPVGSTPPSRSTGRQPPGDPIGAPLRRTLVKVGRVAVDGYFVGFSSKYGLGGNFQTPAPGLPWAYEVIVVSTIAPSVVAKANVERLAKMGPSMGDFGQPVVGKVTATVDCAEDEYDNRVARMRVLSGAQPAYPHSADTSVAVPSGPITRRLDFLGSLAPASRTTYNARTGVGILMISAIESPAGDSEYRPLMMEALFDSSTWVTGADGARLDQEELLSLPKELDATATLEVRGRVLYVSAIKLHDPPD